MYGKKIKLMKKRIASRAGNSCNCTLMSHIVFNVTE